MPDQKVFVITGAGSGIGAACARQLARDGHSVVLIGRRRELLEKVTADTGGLILDGDAADEATWQRFVTEIRDHYGRIDGLIASAGGLGAGKAGDVDEAAWTRALKSNLGTAVASARACLPDLIASRGAIVFVGSIASLAAGPEVCPYTTAKHALIGFSRSIARDYGPHGVRANVVCPGWVVTPMADEEMVPFMNRFGDTLEEAYLRVTRQVPLRRPATAEEVANLCLFLVSPLTSIVTGATITADGGSTIVDVPTLAYDEL